MRNPYGKRRINLLAAYNATATDDMICQFDALKYYRAIYEHFKKLCQETNILVSILLFILLTSTSSVSAQDTTRTHPLFQYPFYEYRASLWDDLILLLDNTTMGVVAQTRNYISNVPREKQEISSDKDLAVLGSLIVGGFALNAMMDGIAFSKGNRDLNEIWHGAKYLYVTTVMAAGWQGSVVFRKHGLNLRTVLTTAAYSVLGCMVWRVSYRYYRTVNWPDWAFSEIDFKPLLFSEKSSLFCHAVISKTNIYGTYMPSSGLELYHGAEKRVFKRFLKTVKRLYSMPICITPKSGEKLA